MKRRAVQLCFIILAAQMVCVAVELWIHARLTVWLSQNSDVASGSMLAVGAIALFWTTAEHDYETVNALEYAVFKSEPNLVQQAQHAF